MKSSSQPRRRPCLVVTHSFLEAADIEEALRALGVEDVTHVRNATSAEAYLCDLAPPSLAIVTDESTWTTMDKFFDRLSSLQVFTIVIDPVAGRRLPHRVSKIGRPYSGKELQRSLETAFRSGV